MPTMQLDPTTLTNGDRFRVTSPKDGALVVTVTHNHPPGPFPNSDKVGDGVIEGMIDNRFTVVFLYDELRASDAVLLPRREPSLYDIARDMLEGGKGQDDAAAVIADMEPGNLPSLSRALDSLAQTATFYAALCDWRSQNSQYTAQKLLDERLGARQHAQRRLKNVRRALGYMQD